MQNFGLFHIKHSVPVVPDVAKHLPKIWEEWGDLSITNNIVGTHYYHRPKKLAVICSLDTMDDDKTYLHVSLSHPNKIPNWETVKMVKELFIGKDRDALIYFPIEDEYVNVMPFCLHLWSEEI